MLSRPAGGTLAIAQARWRQGNHARLAAACFDWEGICGQPQPKMHMITYLGNCVLNDLLVRHIALVAYEKLVDALGGVAVDLLQPLLDVVEAVHIGDIVDDADAVGTAVVGRSDGAEPFLAGGIPLSRSTICQ